MIIMWIKSFKWNETEIHLCFSESVVCLFSDLVKSYLISLNNFPQMDSSGSAVGATEEEDLRAEVTFECSLLNLNLMVNSIQSSHWRDCHVK